MTKSIFAGFCLSGLAALPALSEPYGTPDPADLRIYIFCSDVAAERPLGFEEAVACGHVFDRVKLAFVPGVTPEEFMALETRDRAEVNLVGYRRFREWFDTNPDLIDQLRSDIQADLAGFDG
ncbi:MAG: hypothetical protein KDK11_01110 [Maritimibacter sp.]|nr:hypothetical protein [Maritimibacter sp.]